MHTDILKTVEDMIQANNHADAEELILSCTIDSETLNNVGVIYYNQKKIKLAEKYFLQSIELNNNYYTAIHNLAELYYNTGEKHAASQYYEKYISLNPDDTNTINQLALVYTERGEIRKAYDKLKLSLTINPEQVEPKKILGELEEILSQTIAESKPQSGQNEFNEPQKESNSGSKRNFCTKNPLGLYLKPDEKIEEYVNLIYYLKNSSRMHSKDQLLYLIQINFRNIIISYFNTCSVEKTDIDNLLILLNFIEQRFECKNTIDRSNNESFIISIFNYLNDHLPQSMDKHEICLNDMQTVIKDPLANDNIVSIYKNVSEAFSPLYDHGLLSSFMVHGSMSTLDYTPFSDFDTQIFLTDKVFSSMDYLKKTAMVISGNVNLLKLFDPLQHHGFFLCTDLDRRSYPEAFLPLSTMDCATSVYGEKTQKFFIRQSDYQIKYAVWHTGYFFRTSYILRIFPENPFDIKRFLSRFLLLPVLLLELKENIFPYKRDSFTLARKYFDPEVWQSVEIATKARHDWNPYRTLKFNKDFYRKTFEFSEVILKTLKDCVDE
ncbi:MAG: tetratricopeptide repeat protein [Candidatus Scalindua sp.]